MKAFIICRDRVEFTRRCVASLAAHPDITDLYLIDHGSTYGPMLDYLGQVAGGVTPPPRPHDSFCDWGSPDSQRIIHIHVHWRGNAHPRDVFTNGTLDMVADDELFLLTDCDVEAPADPGWLDHLVALLELNPNAVKAGCGLHTDDLPDHFEHADRVRLWEARYQGFRTLQRDPRTGLAWYNASVDTTLAMYRGRPSGFALDPAVRTADARFMARHLSWYLDSAHLPADEVYYREHAQAGVSMWTNPDNYQGTYRLPEGSQA